MPVYPRALKLHARVIQAKFEAAHEVFDEYIGECIGNGDLVEKGAKGLKMAMEAAK